MGVLVLRLLVVAVGRLRDYHRSIRSWRFGIRHNLANRLMGLALNVLPAGGIAGPWHLIFNDEFNGSSLDATKWSQGYEPPGLAGITGPVNGTNGLDVCDASLVTVANGALSITAILET